MRLGLALRAFWQVLRDRSFAEQVRQLLQGQTLTAPSQTPPVMPETTGPEGVEQSQARSEALTLLAVLQREARWIDFVKEELSGYDDAQIGAAVRDVQRDCAAALERMFALRPLHDQQEGQQVEVPAGFDAVRIKLTGDVTGQPPFRGTLAHQGWQATRCDLPTWRGQDEAARIIAPAEIEMA